jgi:putative NADH-flavin reductase
MNVVLYGSTGNAGSRILKELLARGHQVTAAMRGDLARVSAIAGVSAVQDDLSDADKTAAVIKGADAVISAYGPPPDNTDALVAVTRRQVEAVRKSGVARFLMVGGAGSLEVAPGVSLIASGHLPAAWMPIAKSHAAALKVLQSSDIDWTYFSPAAFFEPGERTGQYRLGSNELITDEKGESRISMEDYAIAMVDELEKGAHHKQQFSVGH